eukprot:scaffold340301_cov51-Prasinocladus_malaysianus.AAC.1
MGLQTTGLPGGVEALVACLRDVSDSLKEASLSALAALISSDREGSDAVVAAGGLLPLVSLLSSPAASLRELAVAVVMGLALSESNRAAVAWAGGIRPLVCLLSTGSPKAKEMAAKALWSLAVSDENKLAIADAGCIPPLVAMLDLECRCTASGREAAAKTLWNLAVAPSNKVAIAAAGGLPALVALLGTGSHYTQESAAGALLELSLNDNNRKKIAKLGAIPLLIRLLTAPGRAEMKEAVAGRARAEDAYMAFANWLRMSTCDMYDTLCVFRLTLLIDSIDFWVGSKY